MIFHNAYERLAYAVGVLAVACVLGLTALQFTQNPVEARYAVKDEGMELATGPDAVLEPDSSEEQPEADYNAMLTNEGRTRLWNPLVTPPPRPPSPPDWGKILTNVTFTMNQIGVGPEAQVQVRTGAGRAVETKWVKVGDWINGAEITDIREASILLEKRQGGSTFTHSVARQMQ